MRILDLTTIYPNPGMDYEGLWVADMERAWGRAGAHVTSFVLKPWMPLRLARILPRYQHIAVPDMEVENEGVKVFFKRYLHLPSIFRTRRFAINVRLMTREILNLIWRSRERFDLIHGQGLYAGLAGAVVASKLAIPFAMTLSDDLSHMDNGPNRSLLPDAYAAFARAKVVFAMGPSLRRDAARFLPEHNAPRLILAPLGVDVEAVRKCLLGLPPRDHESRGRIISIGNLYRLKGIHENLDALRILKERGIAWHNTVVGDGPYRGDLERLAREFGIGESVEFVGHLPHAQAMRLLYNSDIFSLPSWREAFGQVYAEAAVCGIPAIGCRENGPELIIRDGETGLLVPPRDNDALADALEFLLRNPGKAQEMGRRAQERSQDLTWERTGRIYMDAFQAVLGDQ